MDLILAWYVVKVQIKERIMWYVSFLFSDKCKHNSHTTKPSTWEGERETEAEEKEKTWSRLCPFYSLSLFCSPRSHFTTLYVVLRGPLWHGMVYIAGNSCRIILLNFSINVESKAYCKKMKSKYIFLYSFSQSNLCYRLLYFLFEK